MQVQAKFYDLVYGSRKQASGKARFCIRFEES